MFLFAVYNGIKPLPKVKKPEEDEFNINRIIEKAKNGDDNAFEEIVRHYEKFVFNTAHKTLFSSGYPQDRADDVVQMVFIKVWKSLDNFRGDSNFSTWLYRITVNASVDLMRKEGKNQEISLSQESSEDGDDGELWDLPVTSADDIPEDALDRKETIIAVRKAIESLPKDQRDVIVMRDLNGFSYQEISELLQLEPGTVRSRINRGRTRLKEILTEGNFYVDSVVKTDENKKQSGAKND